MYVYIVVTFIVTAYRKLKKPSRLHMDPLGLVDEPLRSANLERLRKFTQRNHIIKIFNETRENRSVD